MKKKERVIALIRRAIVIIPMTLIAFTPSIITAMDAEDRQEKDKSNHLSSRKRKSYFSLELSLRQDERKNEAPESHQEIAIEGISGTEMMRYEYTVEDIANLIECNLPTDTSLQRFKLGENDQETIETLQNIIYRLGSQYILPPYSPHSLIPCLESFLQSPFVDVQPEEIIIPYNPGGHWVILQIRVNEKIHINYIDSLFSEHIEINREREEEVCRSLTPLKRFLESHFSFKEVLPIEIMLARTQEDNKACGPIIIENIRDMLEKERLSFMTLSDHDVLFLRDKQKTQLKSVGKELNLGEFLNISQNSEGSDLDEYPISIASAFRTPLSSSVLESANCYNVESFLKMHAKRLGIYDGPEPPPISQFEIHDKDALITVYSKGEEGSINVYRVYDPQVPAYDPEGRQIFKHQLMNGQEFVPQDKASGGTRVVGFYSIDGERRLCFKQNPEAPGHEIAVRLLYKFLFPEDRKDPPLPASEVILMNDQIFLVSAFIKGENLEQILKKVDTDPNYGNQWNFNLKKFQKLVLFCLLTNPEDCRPQNCIVRMKESNGYEFILIDNERSLIEEFIVYDDPQRGRVETRPHCFLFCFHELLKEPFDIEVNDLALDHLKKYEEEQLYQYVLYEQCREKGVKQAKLCLWYSEKFMRDTSEKLKKIRLYTKNHKEEGCLADLFQEISPKLAEIYKIPKKVSPDSPGNRPKKVHKEDTERIPCKQAVTISFSNILERIREIDTGRIASTAPPSAYAYPSINFCSPFMPDLVYHLPEYTSSNLGDQDSLTTFDLMDNQSLTRRTFLNLGNNGMTDISVKAISRLINLTSLNLSSNLITNIGVKAISRLINLISLCLSDGTWRITDISTLGQLINLTYLDLQNNSITSVSTLGQLTKLTYLNLRNNKVADIRALRELINLTYLNLGRNQIEDISALDQLTNLIDLDLTSGNQWEPHIIHIDSLGRLIKLTSLVLCSNQVTNLSTLGLLDKLTFLNLYENCWITDINALSELTNLTYLNLGLNRAIKDIRFLGQLTNLTYLNLGGNKIEDIDILGQLTNLTFLDLWNNRIIDIRALGRLVNLTSLELGINQITDINPLGSLIKLTSLSLFHNQITNIKILKNLPKLTSLYLSGNPIEDRSFLRKPSNITSLYA